MNARSLRHWPEDHARLNTERCSEGLHSKTERAGSAGLHTCNVRLSKRQFCDHKHHAPFNSIEQAVYQTRRALLNKKRVWSINLVHWRRLQRTCNSHNTTTAHRPLGTLFEVDGAFATYTLRQSVDSDEPYK